MQPYDINHQEYASLYARYLKSRAGEVWLDDIERVADISSWQGLAVLDICGGGGRAGIAAQAAGANVLVVDGSPTMLEDNPLPKAVGKMPYWLSDHSKRYDVAWCQQAVNYWLNERGARDLALVLKPGGIFVFNTFNTLPSTIPTVKNYEFEGAHFTEASWTAQEGEQTLVHHVQIREGRRPHFTFFAWISPEDYMRILTPYFYIERHTQGKSDIYVCRRKLTVLG